MLRKPLFLFGAAAAADPGAPAPSDAEDAPPPDEESFFETVTASVDERFVCRTENGRKCKESFEYNDRYYT